MAPDLPAGTVVVVDPGEPAEDGCIAIVELDGEVLLRRLRLRDTGERRTARFTAPGLPDLVPDGDWRRSVRGVVTGARARLAAPNRLPHLGQGRPVLDHAT